MQTVTIPQREYEEFLRWRHSHARDDEAWFWSKEWQKKEAEADADIKAGRISGPFQDIESLLRDLKGKPRKHHKKAKK